MVKKSFFLFIQILLMLFFTSTPTYAMFYPWDNSVEYDQDHVLNDSILVATVKDLCFRIKNLCISSPKSMFMFDQLPDETLVVICSFILDTGSLNLQSDSNKKNRLDGILNLAGVNKSFREKILQKTLPQLIKNQEIIDLLNNPSNNLTDQARITIFKNEFGYQTPETFRQNLKRVLQENIQALPEKNIQWNNIFYKILVALSAGSIPMVPFLSVILVLRSYRLFELDPVTLLPTIFIVFAGELIVICGVSSWMMGKIDRFFQSYPDNN